jgi:hypothetical protein
MLQNGPDRGCQAHSIPKRHPHHRHGDAEEEDGVPFGHHCQLEPLRAGFGVGGRQRGSGNGPPARHCAVHREGPRLPLRGDAEQVGAVG